MAGLTVDTNQLYKLVLFSNGQVKAIPEGIDPPAVPTGLAATVKLSSVSLTWDPVVYSRYIVARDGVALGTVAAPRFQDQAVTVGQTYTYTVQSIDIYGLRSEPSPSVSAFIDPALQHDAVRRGAVLAGGTRGGHQGHRAGQRHRRGRPDRGPGPGGGRR